MRGVAYRHKLADNVRQADHAQQAAMCVAYIGAVDLGCGQLLA